MTLEKPLLSVCIICYKHQQFIKKTIEGVLRQQVDFDFEIVISEDYPQDGSEAIVKGISDYDTTKINLKYYTQKKNLGMCKNVLFALNKCKGKYIAICEGDDYWIEEDKVKWQIEFLEENQDYELCFTNIKIIDEEGKTLKDRLIDKNRKDIYSLSDLPIWAPFLTRVFKNRDFNTLIRETPALDTYMLVGQAKFGKIKFIDAVSAAYRKHSGGIYSALSKAQQKEKSLITTLHCMEIINSEYHTKYYGILLKLLLGIRNLDKGLFKKNKQLIHQVLSKNKKDLSSLLNYKIKLILYLLNVPYLGMVNTSSKFTNRLINQFFYYGKPKN